MTKDQIERFALLHFLSEFPHDAEYEQILDLIYESDESVVIWEPFECYTPEWVVEHIEEMVDCLASFVKESQNA